MTLDAYIQSHAHQKLRENPVQGEITLQQYVWVIETLPNAILLSQSILESPLSTEIEIQAAQKVLDRRWKWLESWRSHPHPPSAGQKNAP